MLQQTQVARVIPRYEAWLERWPDAAALAAASAADVLREWVGLGYNRRALRLRDACVAVARDGWPATASGLRALPGVGPYTAAAVASFAFDEQVAAVDVNVARVSGAARRRARGARAGGPRRVVQPRDDGSRRDDLHRAPRALRGLPAWRGCARRRARSPRPAARRARQRFEDTDRFARGRIVAALAAGEAAPGRTRGGADRARARGARARRARRPRRRRGSSALAGHL